MRSKLAELIGRFGLDPCNDEGLSCEALLRDACNEHKREIKRAGLVEANVAARCLEN